MHLYVLSRGNYDIWMRWIGNLLAKYYPKKMENGIYHAIQLGVRPIIPLEIVFPEPCLKEVLSIVYPYDKIERYGKYSNLLSKMMGLKPIPKVKQSPDLRFVNPHKMVSVMGIGLKKDIIHPKTGEEML